MPTPNQRFERAQGHYNFLQNRPASNIRTFKAGISSTPNTIQGFNPGDYTKPGPFVPVIINGVNYGSFSSDVPAYPQTVVGTPILNSSPVIAVGPHIKAPNPQRVQATASIGKVSSFASKVLRWNTINGSGPVSNTQFLRASATDHSHNHDWIFGRDANSDHKV